MIGGLDSSGNFFLLRKEGKTEVKCPYQGRACGTWCAQFSEPFENTKESKKNTLVHICQGKYWKFTKFVDERPDNLKRDQELYNY